MRFCFDVCPLWVETACGAFSHSPFSGTIGWALNSWQSFRDAAGGKTGNIIPTRLNESTIEASDEAIFAVLQICIGVCES